MCHIYFFFKNVTNFCFKSGTLDMFVAGGHLTLVGPINAFIHTVMYAYYFTTATWPKYKNSLWWKKHLTQLQMVMPYSSYSPGRKVISYFEQGPFLSSGALSLASHRGSPGSNTGQIMCVLWCTKCHWGTFPLGTSVSSANFHSTNCSAFIIIVWGWYNKPNSGRRTSQPKTLKHY
jgi:hypothetical protein